MLLKVLFLFQNSFIMTPWRKKSVINSFKTIISREFPGGPVVRTQRFHCRGLGSTLCWELRSCKPRGAAK